MKTSKFEEEFLAYVFSDLSKIKGSKKFCVTVP